MPEIVADTASIAFCGLYCGACRKYLQQRCPGCQANEKAGWCKIRLCCREKNIAGCADCTEYTDVRLCKKFNNFMARLFGLVFRSDRAACIDLIKKSGYEAYAREMSAKERMSIKRQKKSLRGSNS